jgi:uncharacterized protein (TIGR02996 family)
MSGAASDECWNEFSHGTRLEMATSIESLLAAILDEPTDLDRRLVYADALQEQNDPRGEFIVHHIAGRQEAETLLKKHGKEWIAFLRPAVSRAGLRFINGFVERITLKVEHLGLLRGFMEREPIHEVRFRDLGREPARLASRPTCTRRITWLDVKHAHLSGKGFATLMEGQWDRLWRIWAPSNGIGAVGVQALIDASPPCLKSLNLHGAQLHNSTLVRLAAWPGLARIEELNLRGNNLSDDALAALLAAAPVLRWIGLPAVGEATLNVLAARAVESITSLVVTEAGDNFRLLQQVYGDRVVLNPAYESNFDLSWP